MGSNSSSFVQKNAFNYKKFNKIFLNFTLDIILFIDSLNLVNLQLEKNTPLLYSISLFICA